ncbi:hypothetical protein T439DRAFT_96357 [Meredithblackwellia eburnea MCA 4105]
MKCSKCLDPYCDKECQRLDWKTHKTYCVSIKKVLDEREQQVLQTASFEFIRDALIKHALSQQLELYSAIFSSLHIHSPSPLYETHTLLITVKFDSRNPDETLRFKTLDAQCLPHEEVRSALTSHKKWKFEQENGISELGDAEIRTRPEYKGGKAASWYTGVVFLCPDSFEYPVCVTRYVELPKQREGKKPDWKTNDSKQWKENYLRCISKSGKQVPVPGLGPSSPRFDEFLRQQH